MDGFIMPMPKLLDLKRGSISETEIGQIQIDDNFDERINNFANVLKGERGRKLLISRDSALKKFDEYQIDFGTKTISVSAGTFSGVYRGLRTLEQIQKREMPVSTGHIHDWADLEMRIQHVDLKRIGWNFDYLLKLVDFFAVLKINFILLEYEDKFKYEFCDKIPVKSAFDRKQIAELEKKAYENFIKIIPLAQCIGHYEYILKHDKYKELSENPKIRKQACPLHPGTLELFKNMASELMEAHPSSEYFHIGGDEPFFLGDCPKCSAYAERKSKGGLYSEYVNKILSWLIDEKGKKPIMWADVMKHHKEVVETCRKDVIVLDWTYSPQNVRIKLPENAENETDEKEKILNASKLTEEQYLRYGKYLDYSPETKEINSLPFGAYLRDQDFQVIGGSCVSSVDNVLTHSLVAEKNGFLGTLGTYWASADSLRMPFAIFETRLAGVCMLGASSWNVEYEKSNRQSFFERVSEYLNGVKTYAIVYEIFNLSHNIVSPNDNNQAGEEYFKKVSTALKSISGYPGKHLEVLMNLIKKIKLEKDLEQFKKEMLSSPVLPEAFYNKIDILPYCNERFSNTDETPGWSRIPQNDLRFFPRGEVCFNGVPFRINPDLPETEKKSIIMIGDYPSLPFYPKSVKGINIGKKAFFLSFLHAHVEGQASNNGFYGKYVLTYADGEKEVIPLIYNKNMGAWWRIVEIEDASIAWSGENLRKAKVGLYMHTYFPERNDKEIASVDFDCESQSVLALAAITVASDEILKNKQNLPIIKKVLKFEESFLLLKEKMRSYLKNYLSEDGMDEILKIAFGFSMKYLDFLKKSFGSA